MAKKKINGLAKAGPFVVGAVYLASTLPLQDLHDGQAPGSPPQAAIQVITDTGSAAVWNTMVDKPMEIPRPIPYRIRLKSQRNT